MVDAISVKPMVDILTELSGKAVVMREETYVYMDGTDVEQEHIESGVVKQQELTVIATQKAFTDAIQAHLDTKAQEKGYDNIVSACSYAGYVNPFQDEAVAYGTWRASVWAYAYEQLALIQSEDRDIPTVDEFILELPTLEV